MPQWEELVEPLVPVLRAAFAGLGERLYRGWGALHDLIDQLDQGVGSKRFFQEWEAPTSGTVSGKILIHITGYQDDTEVLPHLKGADG